MHTTPIFQAVGILQGKITQNRIEPYLFSIEVNGISYKLKAYHTRRKIRNKIIKQIENGNNLIRVVVYPKAKINSQNSRKSEVKFYLANFLISDNNKLSEILSENEFILSGIYQKVNGCKDNCITILKNKNERNELLFEKQKTKGRLKYFFPVNIPIKWKDAVISPYDIRNQEKQQKYFVSIKAKFSAKRGTFTFKKLLSTPTIEIPEAIFVESEIDSYLEVGV